MTLRRPFMTFFGAMILAMQIGGAGLEAPPPLLRRNGKLGGRMLQNEVCEK